VGKIPDVGVFGDTLVRISKLSPLLDLRLYGQVSKKALLNYSTLA
jgi:hypothetical protein